MDRVPFKTNLTVSLVSPQWSQRPKECVWISWSSQHFGSLAAPGKASSTLAVNEIISELPFVWVKKIFSFKKIILS